MAILLVSAIIASVVICAAGIVLRRSYAAKVPGQRALADLLLAALAERDPDLGAHSCDVAGAATIAARQLGLSRRCVEQVRLAAELHDVGKLAIPERILCKPGPLDRDEWEVMRMHAEVGAQILDAMPAMAPIGALVLASHERHDGAGYPSGLRGGEIPLGARIIAVCDAYDAMTTQRVYNRPASPADALQRLCAASGSQFDPTVVDVVCHVIQDMLNEQLVSTGPVVAENRAATLKPVPSGTLFA